MGIANAPKINPRGTDLICAGNSSPFCVQSVPLLPLGKMHTRKDFVVLKSLDAFPVVFVIVDFANCMWHMRKGQYFRPPALVCLANFLGGYLELVLEKTMPHGTAGGGPLAPEGLPESTQRSGEAEGCGEEPEPLPQKGLVLGLSEG